MNSIAYGSLQESKLLISSKITLRYTKIQYFVDKPSPSITSNIDIYIITGVVIAVIMVAGVVFVIRKK